MRDLAVPADPWNTDKTAEGILAERPYAGGSDVRRKITVPKDGVVQPGTVIGHIDGA